MLPAPKGMRFLTLSLFLLMQTACAMPIQSPVVSQPSASPSASSGYHQISQAEYSPDSRWLLWNHEARADNGMPIQTLGWTVYDTQNNTHTQLKFPE